MSYSFWGAFTAAMILPFISTVGLFSALRQRFLDHEAFDEHRFTTLHEDTKEIKADIKTLLARDDRRSS